MAFESTERMLEDAQRGGYAIGAFGFENMEMAQAIIAAADATRSPVILQTTPSTIQYASVWQYQALVKALCRDTAVPVALHLDHSDSYLLAVDAIMAGYTSVMIDGSAKPFAENVSITRRVVDIARPQGVPVEAELAASCGNENAQDASQAFYTNPEMAADFIRQTGAQSLAVAIGAAHGMHTKKQAPDLRLLEAIREQVSVPLVLHSASGISEEDVGELIRRGICKVNFAAELCMAYTDGVRAVLSEAPQSFDPKTYGASGRQRVQSLAAHWMRALGCAGRV